MQNHRYPRAPRRVWLALAVGACAALVGLGLATMADSEDTVPAAAPPLTLVGETSTPKPTTTASPTQTGGPTPTGGPTSGPAPTPTEEGPCSGGAVYDGGSRDWRASVDCVDFGTTALLPGHYKTHSEAEQAGSDWADYLNQAYPVMDGPGCRPPFIFC